MIFRNFKKTLKVVGISGIFRYNLGSLEIKPKKSDISKVL
jgi:hypothetical protein